MQRSAVRTALLLVVLAGCGGGPAPVPADAGTDTGPVLEDASAVDAFVPVDAPPACDVSPAPDALVPLVGGFVVLDATGPSPIPVQTGGDPTGVWRFDQVTIYTGPESEGMFDADTSTIEGEGWAVVEGDTIRLELTLDVALMGTVAGTIRRHTVTSIRGTFVVDAETLTLTPECISPMPMPGGGTSPTFTAEGTTGTLVLTTMGMLGTNQIVLSGARTAT